MNKKYFYNIQKPKKKKKTLQTQVLELELIKYLKPKQKYLKIKKKNKIKLIIWNLHVVQLMKFIKRNIYCIFEEEDNLRICFKKLLKIKQT